ELLPCQALDQSRRMSPSDFNLALRFDFKMNLRIAPEARHIQTVRGLARGCVKNALVERGAVPEMKEDPSEPACRSRLQTAVSCCRPMAGVVNVTEKAREHRVMCGLDRRAQANHRRGLETNLQMASKPERPLSPGRAWRQPDYWPCGVRGRGGVTPAWALVRN